MKKPLLLGAPLLAIALMGLGCNPFASVQTKVNERIGDSIAEKAIEAQLGGDLKINTGGTGSLPANFPSDVPRYPGAVYASSYVKDNIAIANFTTADSAADVTAWFEAQLLAGGFKRFEGDLLTGTVRVYEKDDIHLVVQAMRSEKSNVTGVSIQRSVTKN